MTNSPNVEVGILRANKVDFFLGGKYETDGGPARCFGRCMARLENDRIIIENNDKQFSFEGEVAFIPCNISSDYFEIRDVVIGIDFHWEQKETQKFQGALWLVKDGDKIQIINTIPVENYLISVISSEMNANSSPELLKAHAIISRSWLIAQMQKGDKIKKSGETGVLRERKDEHIQWFDREDHEKFHVCADDHCQRYQGISRASNPRVIEAISKTRAMVLSFDNSICDTRYSKCCGGKTERFSSCWEEVDYPYLASFDDSVEQNKERDLTQESNVKDFIENPPEAFCNTDDEHILEQVLNDYDREEKDFYRWEKTYSQREISELIKTRSGHDFGKIKDLVPIERGASGRLVKLKIEGEKKNLVIGKELIIRRWLSNSHLYSSAFIIEKKDGGDGFPSEFILKGAGWGHGVGLCQIGAAVMGEKGYQYDAILNHYYPGAQISDNYGNN
jgi:SpoIID/LytB domain protein